MSSSLDNYDPMGCHLSQSDPLFRRQLSMPGSSREHNLKHAGANISASDDYTYKGSIGPVDSAIGSSITSSSKTLNDSFQPRSRRRSHVVRMSGDRSRSCPDIEFQEPL